MQATPCVSKATGKHRPPITRKNPHYDPRHGGGTSDPRRYAATIMPFRFTTRKQELRITNVLTSSISISTVHPR
ncbi:hypothetical protein WN51_12542 [Melipona quadrifasciata]|uniref:Uncharacterized protein n=1 Tax=Melipona quadrifasciata TaxID=166423 RepID=A0A0M9A2P3_9HYME|nr:hypothetical protein WN51_12542 [Melipona quadrifasciata]